MNNNFNSKYRVMLECDYTDELNIIIDIFDNFNTQVLIFNKSNPKFLSNIDTDEQIFEFCFAFNNNTHDFLRYADYKDTENYKYLITSKNNDTKYSYELLCAEYIQYIINSIYKSYGYRYTIPNRLFKVNQITFIVNDAIDLKILDMICKILHNRYVFKYIKRSDCIKNMLTYDNISGNKQIVNPNDCVIYVDEHSTYFMKYYTNDNLFTECRDVQHFDYGFNDLIKDIQSSIPRIKIGSINKYLNDLNAGFKQVGFNYKTHFPVDDIKNIKFIINNYLNKITEYMNNFFNDQNYNIHVFGNINNNISIHCSQLRQHNVKYIFNYFAIQLYCDAINNIDFIFKAYNDFNVPNNLRNLITDEIITLYNSNKTNDEMFYYAMHNYELYKYFIDGKYIPFINDTECELSKNLLDMYTFDTNINTNNVMYLSIINTINCIINSRKLKDLFRRTGTNEIYDLEQFLNNYGNLIDNETEELLREIIYECQIKSYVTNNGNQIITYVPTQPKFKDYVKRFIERNRINVNNLIEYCKRYIYNTK